VCDLETSRMGAPYIYIYYISHLRVNQLVSVLGTHLISVGSRTEFFLKIT
jgi:hypothetical protein